MTNYKPGDRVRVTFEGAVDNVYDVDLTVVGPDNRRALIDNDVPGYVVEKITPDYKAQIEALEPGTAFVLTTNQVQPTYFRTTSGVVSKLGGLFSVSYILDLHGTVTDIRILK